MLNNLKSLGLSDIDLASFENNDSKTLNLGEELNDFETLKEIPKKHLLDEQDFSEPFVGFWETSTVNIQEKLAIQEELKEFSRLCAVNNSRMFFLPENYFEDFSHQIKHYLHSNEDKYSIKQHIFFWFDSHFLKYAFSILFVAVFIGIYILYYNKPITSHDCELLSCIEQKEMMNASIIHHFTDEQLYELVDEQQFSRHMNSTFLNYPLITLDNDDIEILSTNLLMEEL